MVTRQLGAIGATWAALVLASAGQLGAQALIGKEARQTQQDIKNEVKAEISRVQSGQPGTQVGTAQIVSGNGNTFEVKIENPAAGGRIDNRIDTVRVANPVDTTKIEGVAAPAGTSLPAPRTDMVRGDATAMPLGAPLDPNYEIGAEDVLFVKVWREADFTGQYAVRPDGKITVPLIGDMKAAGLTTDTLTANLKIALSDYILRPEVNVIVISANSKKFYIAGEVNRPGIYPLVVPTRVFDALSSAGGFREFANRKDIVIVRGTKRLKFNYAEVLKGKKLDQNIFLESGDTLIVK